LTQLSIAALVNIPEQVSLLLSYMMSDQRKSVKFRALEDLRLVAVQAPHLWSQENWKTVVGFAVQENHPQLKSIVLSLLGLLAESRALPELVYNTEMRKLCLESACCKESPRVAVQGTKVLTNVVLSCIKLRLPAVDVEEPPVDGFIEDALLTIQAQVFLLLCKKCSTDAELETNKHQLLQVLKSVVRLASSDEQVCARYISVFGPFVLHITGPKLDILIEALCAMGSGGGVEAVAPLLGDLLQLLATKPRPEVLVKLLTLLFQCTSGSDWPDTTTKVVNETFERLGPWERYRIVRQAARLVPFLNMLTHYIFVVTVEFNSGQFSSSFKQTQLLTLQNVLDYK
jgi:hypothetical protein